MGKFRDIYEAKTANGKKLKRGDKVRVNRQGSKPEKVLSVNGTTVYTYENPNSSTHITKLVKLDEGKLARLPAIKKIIKQLKPLAKKEETVNAFIWDLETYDDLTVAARTWAAGDTYIRDEIMKVVDKVDSKIMDKILKIAGSKRI